MLRFLRDPVNRRVGLGAFPASTSADRLDLHVLNCFGYPPVPFADMGMLRGELLRELGYLDTGFTRFGWDPDL